MQRGICIECSQQTSVISIGDQMGMHLWFARGGGGFLRICFTHSSRSGIELVPSFLTVISSRGHWCRLLDFCSFVSTSGFEK